MKSVRRTLFVLLFTSLCVAALGSNPVGHWKGKMHMHFSSPPGGATNPQQQQMMAQMKAAMEKMTLTLDLKKDHTYTVHMTGGPTGGGEHSDHGTWSQSGNKVTLTGSKDVRRGRNSQEFALSKDGKTMSFNVPNGQGNVVFTRG